MFRKSGSNGRKSERANRDLVCKNDRLCDIVDKLEVQLEKNESLSKHVETARWQRRQYMLHVSAPY